MKKKAVNLRLEEELHQDALLVSKYLGISVSGLIRIALKTYISRYVKKAKEGGSAS